jgi:acetyl-CoA acetyltransferase
MSGARDGLGAIVGLGLTQQGRGLGLSTRELRRRALDAALEDAGIGREQLDGYILVGSGFEDLRYLGINPHFSYALQSGGASPLLAVTSALGAIATGQADYVACVYGESWTSGPPLLTPNNGGPERMDIGSYSYGYPYTFGLVGPGSVYALQAQRHMGVYGTTSEQLGAVAVVGREYGAIRPGSVGFGQPITIEDHQASRMVVDPLRLLDCSRPTDGGAAVIVTSLERAKDCAGKGVAVLGLGAGHGIGGWWNGTMFDAHGDARGSGERAFAQAGLTPDDVDVAQFYDAFSIAILLQLEQYGFCKPGESGPFVESGATRVDGAIPVNTGGGQLSGFYATGFTPLSEGILQVRGTAPSSQVPDVEVCLVSGHGGNGGVAGSWAHASGLLGPL